MSRFSYCSCGGTCELCQRTQQIAERTISRCGCSGSVKPVGLKPSPAYVKRVLSNAGVEILGTAQTAGYRVDVSYMWSTLRDRYRGGDLLPIATREAFQNSLDAIRMAKRARKLTGSGRFGVKFDAKARTISWEDNGIGMSAEVIENKFLVLGESGKRDQAGMGGGMGVAKAVILGLSNNWAIWSNDTYCYRNPDTIAAAKGNMAAEARIGRASASRIGTRIDVEEIDPMWIVGNRYLDGFSRNEKPAEWVKGALKLIQSGYQNEQALDVFGKAYLTLEQRIQFVLAASDLEELEVTYNNQPVTPFFPTNGRNVTNSYDYDWGKGTAVTVKRYSQDSNAGRVFVRCNGVFQFALALAEYGKAIPYPYDFVVDLQTTARADSGEYPMTLGRDGFQAEAPAQAFQALVAQIRNEAREKGGFGVKTFKETYYLGDTEAEKNGAVAAASQFKEAIDSPEFKAKIAELLKLAKERKGAVQFFGELFPAKKKGDLAEAESEAGEGGTLPGRRDARGKLIAVLDQMERVNGNKGNVRGVKEALEQGQDLSERDVQQIQKAFDETKSMSTLEKVNVQQAIVNFASSTKKQGLVAAAQNMSPLGKAFTIFIKEETGDVNEDRGVYPGQRVAAFQRNLNKYAPYLFLWDAILRMVVAEVEGNTLSIGYVTHRDGKQGRFDAYESEGRRRPSAKLGSLNPTFVPGFILDSQARATNAGPRRDVPRAIMLNPFYVQDYVDLQKKSAKAIAVYLWGLACHELAHCVETSHDENFSIEREQIGFTTAHLLPTIEVLCAKMLDLALPATVPTTDCFNTEFDLELAKEEANELRRKLAAVEADRDTHEQLLDTCDADITALKRQISDLQKQLEEAGTGAEHVKILKLEKAAVEQTLRNYRALQFGRQKVIEELNHAPLQAARAVAWSIFHEIELLQLVEAGEAIEAPVIHAGQQNQNPPARTTSACRMANAKVQQIVQARPDCRRGACEAVYRMSGGKNSQLQPMQVVHHGEFHPFLVDGSGKIIDPLAQQRSQVIPYERGTRLDFGDQPSVQCATILAHVCKQ